jgi:hypothetical protein
MNREEFRYRISNFMTSLPQDLSNDELQQLYYEITTRVTNFKSRNTLRRARERLEEQVRCREEELLQLDWDV